MVIASPITWLVFPQLTLAFLATFISWYFPLVYEWRWIHRTFALINFLAWLAVAVSVVRQMSTW